MTDEIAVVGWAQTRHRASMPRETHQSMIYEVVTRALDSCNVNIEDVDVVVSAGSDFLDGRGISTCITVDAMGAQLKEESKVAQDGLHAAIYAYMRIASGVFDTALVVAYGKSSESSIRDQTGAMADPFYLRPIHLDAVSAGALQANAYLNHYGVDREACSMVAVKNRAAGASNPYAQLRKEVTLDEVTGSPELVEPIRRLEACPVSDGACAVLMASGNTARSLGARPAWISGLGYSTDAYYPGAREIYRSPSAERAARSAYDMAGIADPLGELSVMEISEFYAYQELMLYEAMGLCEPGEGSELLQAGLTEPAGEVAVNPSGGVLCANPLVATGLVRLAEASAQVSGRAGEIQVEGARKAIAHAGGGFAMQTAAAVVLET